MRITPLRNNLRYRGWWIVPLWLSTWQSAPALANLTDQGDFARNLSAWEKKIFAGETRYQAVTYQGQDAVQADSMQSASGLVLRVSVDLRQTPYLNWSWAIQDRLAVGDEHSKAGDDYPARVYVIFSTGPFFWQTRAINYVWSSQQMPGSHWPNAYTEKSTMVAVRGPTDPLGAWRSEKRNVLDDIRQLTGEAVFTIDAVAIMTDTDNSGLKARAWYGGLYFSAN